MSINQTFNSYLEEMKDKDFYKAINDIDKQIKKLKNQKDKIVKQFRRQLDKEWRTLVASTNINDMSEWKYEILDKSDF